MATRRRKLTDWDKEQAARARIVAEDRERMWTALWADPRYLRIEAKKEAALRAARLAENTALVTKRPSDQARAERAAASRKRALRALYKYEAAFERAWKAGRRTFARSRSR